MLLGVNQVSSMPGTARSPAAAVHILRMVKGIVKIFHPKQIILFGSHVRGEAGPDRDVDLRVGHLS